MWAELLSLGVKMPGSAAKTPASNPIGDRGLVLPQPGSGFAHLPCLGSWGERERLVSLQPCSRDAGAFPIFWKE